MKSSKAQFLQKTVVQVVFIEILLQLVLAVPVVLANSNADYLLAARSALSRGDAANGRQLLSHVDVHTCNREQVADFFFLKGDAARQQNSFPEAFQYYKRANAMRSTYETMLGLSICFLEFGDYAECASYASKGLKLKPEDPSLYWYLARSQAHMGNLEEAVRIFTDSLKVADPTSGIYKDTLRERAAVYMAMELPEKAQRDLVELNKLPLGKDCTLGGIYSISFKYSRDLGRYLRDAGHIGDNPVLSELEQVRTKMAANPNAEELKSLRLREAELEMYLGHYQKALDLVRVIEQQGDSGYRAHSIKAAALFGLKQYDQAKEERKITIDLYISERFNSSKQAPEASKSQDSAKVQHL